MNLIAHGIDLVETGRVAAMMKEHGERFLARVFTPAEVAYARSTRDEIEKLSVRFAAKEAVLKLVGTGWRGKIAWTDIEVINNERGQPIVTLSGEVARIAAELGIEQISISITHTANFAIASAVALAR
jgi:holo-[acyl-carrier protein] synthase